MTSPVVVHGLFYGNLTIFLLVPLAVAWRYRDRANVAGLAVGVAVAAKLFAWPLVVWLLLTRRFRSAAWAVSSSVALVLAAWAVIGFEGLADYPALLREIQDVYAVRSISLASVAGALGSSLSVAVAVSAIAGLLLLALAAWLARRVGERRSFSIVVAACIVATPIVWPNYAALLFVPIAITWPRLAPAWFFGYLIWLIGAIAPKPVSKRSAAGLPACPSRPGAGAADADAWYAAGTMLVVVGLALLAGSTRSPSESRSV